MEDKELFKKLSYAPVNANEKYTEELKESAFSYCEGYKDFLSAAKTEREAASAVRLEAEKNGFKNIDEFSALKAGDKIYAVNSDKGITLAIIGKAPITDGVNLVGAHIDSPRLDLKSRPLFEDENMAWLRTQYYGGIKKYQWPTIPLAMHGVIVKQDGSRVEINIGEKEDDPVFTITDLLPHLAHAQEQQTLTKAFNADNFHILFASLPKGGEDIKEKVKFGVLCILNDTYGITEEDFTSAEIEFVPSGRARDIGIDRSMIGAYGQDDRVCAYAGARALFDTSKIPEKTAVCMLVDKEEIGSMGRTGMQSRFFEMFLSKLIALGGASCSADVLNRALYMSECLSADVGATYDPHFPEVSDRQNAAMSGSGVLVCKYTGGRGKSSSSEANAEFAAKIRRLFNDNDVLWQNGELGKVDVGGGGTIAQYVANLGLNVIDCGTPLLCMHAPFEISNKFDCYMTYKAYKVFFEN